MVARLRAWLPFSAGLLLTLAGCRGVAPTPSPVARVPSPRPITRPRPVAVAHAAPKEQPTRSEIQPVSFQQLPEPPKDPKTPLGERLQLPDNLPGRNAPIISLPEMKPGNETARKEAIDRHFPALPALPELPKPQPGADGNPVTLKELQDTALHSNPQIRQANAAIEAARGVALQASLYPNPTAGYAGDTWNMGSTIGTQGAYIGQKIKTGGKLHLAFAAASLDVENAELNRRKIEIDVLTQVRKGYFDVLVAERSLSVARAFAGLTTEVYSIQVTRLRQGQAAVDEPLQARVLATQARAAHLRSRNRYLSAWKQLAAAMGRPELSPLSLRGDLERDVPRFTPDEVLKRVLSIHPDMLTAENSLTKAQIQLQLAQVTPKPDIDLGYKLQYDQTTLPNNAVHSVSVGFEIPLWNRNQGGIREAEARLTYNSDERERVRNDLTARVAAAFEKYDNARAITLMYRDQIVPDQARAYRNMYRRYDTVPESLNFNDVITSQQTLAESIRNYVESIGNLWDSVNDMANLLQMDDLFETPPEGESRDRCPIPHLESMAAPEEKHTTETPAKLEETTASTPAMLKAAGVTVEEPTVKPEASAPPAGETELSSEAKPRKVGFKVRPVDETMKKVSFDVRQLRDSHRMTFDVVPVKDAP